MNNQILRRKLKEIVDDTADKETFPEQLSRISELKQICHHSIELLQEADLANQCTCYMFAFDLMDQDAIRSIYYRSPNAEFTSYLVHQYLQNIPRTEATDGDYVIYFDGNEIKHAGKYKDSRVVSKWGGGHFWKHGFDEVSTDYGNNWHFYRKISSEKCMDVFKEWVKLKKGVK